MKFRLLLSIAITFCASQLFAQGLIVHEHSGKKDTVIINTVDSISFSKSMVIHHAGGKKDSIAVSAIDSLSFNNAINPLPSIESISPTGAYAGSGDFLLSVHGSNFINASVVQWNGIPLVTDFISSTDLQATVPASVIDSVKIVAVTVFTPLPGGGPSSAITFTVAAVTSITEGFETGTKGAYAAADVTLSTGVWNMTDALIGNQNDVKNGKASARVRLAGKVTMKFDLKTGAGTVKILHASYGTDQPVTWGLWYSTNSGTSWTQTGSIITTSKKTFDTASFTPDVSGLVRFEIRKTDSTSNRVNLDDITIFSYGTSSNNPAPVLASISPSTDTIGAAGFTLTVNGSNFLSTSVVLWNGNSLPTTYVSSSQMQASVPATYLAATGTANVTVFTPNAGTSSGVIFTITIGSNSPVPAVRYISPTTCSPGSAAFTLSVFGGNFVKSSMIRWNSGTLPTTFVSSTELQGIVPADSLVSAGSAAIDVYTAPPSGGTSSALTFTVAVPVPGAANINLTMGNPSGAVHDVNSPQNYLIERGQYCLSYNRDRGIANWVSWELDTSWFGSASRGNFMTDISLPQGWYEVNTGDYSNTGFSRGHMCPSADRTKSEADNDTVFYMTNIIPQTQAQNGGPWEQLETYERTLANQGNKLYIIAGVYGEGGTGLNGYMTSFAGGKITVPAKTWKVIIVLPAGTNDVSRVTKDTRCIAVLMNNDEGPFNASWGAYRVSVDSIETLTGYDFFSNVSPDIQAAIESVVDNGPTQ